jgi:hypothetical protein
LDTVRTINNLGGGSYDALSAPDPSPFPEVCVAFEGHGETFTIRAFGDIFKRRNQWKIGSGEVDISTIHGEVRELRNAWTDNVVDFRDDTSQSGSPRYPFLHEWNLSHDADRIFRDRVGRTPARVGANLFKLLFMSGDKDAKWIGSSLSDLLRGSDPCSLVIESDVLFVPWQMLYLPPEPNDNVDAESFICRKEGFLGYRHSVAHSFPKQPTRHGDLCSVGQPQVGLYADTTIDEGYYDPKDKPVQAIAGCLRGNGAHVSERHSSALLAEALTDNMFNDELMVFCCHATVGETESGAASSDLPKFALTGGSKISTGFLTSWLRSRDRPLPDPIILFNACQGGQMRSIFYKSFSMPLIEHGASCLIGPQIDLPIPFAREFTTRFLERLLSNQAPIRVSEITRDLTRLFMDEYHNPLGLILSLYGEIATRLVLTSEVPL